jgi:hypothetical protein
MGSATFQTSQCSYSNHQTDERRIGAWAVAAGERKHSVYRRPQPSIVAQHAGSARKRASYGNADGSVDIYLQAGSPGMDKEANWLPTPRGKFSVMLRLYWPKETPPSILDGTWKPPPIKAA